MFDLSASLAIDYTRPFPALLADALMYAAAQSLVFTLSTAGFTWSPWYAIQSFGGNSSRSLRIKINCIPFSIKDLKINCIPFSNHHNHHFQVKLTTFVCCLILQDKGKKVRLSKPNGQLIIPKVIAFNTLAMLLTPHLLASSPIWLVVRQAWQCE